MYNYEDNNNQGNEEEIFVTSTPVVEEVKHGTKKGGKFKRGIAYTLVFGLVAGATFGGVMTLTNNTPQSLIEGEQTPGTEGLTADSTNGQTIVQTSSVTGTTVNDVSAVVAEVMPSIVSITSTATIASNYFGQQVSQEQEGSGSGIILAQKNDELLIVTNNHVISDADRIEVFFFDDTSVEATIKGTDSSNDLAVVSVNLADLTEETKANIRIATLGDSDESQVGEMVIAIGNALGYGQSVTVGYLSAKDREVQTEDYTMNLLQTDAAINPGNSGGALINAAGQVIGINSVKYSSTEVEGIGYAIPISHAVPIINELMNREQVAEEEQGYLGVKFTEVTATISERYNMPEGIFVSEVVSGSPAEAAGIVAGDIIIGMDSRSTTTLTAFQELLQSKKAGSQVVFQVQRVNNGEYQEQSITVTLGNKPESMLSSSTQESTGTQNGSNNTFPGRN